MNTTTPARSAAPARTAAPVRKNAAAKGGTGWKVFIMAASLAATIGGWGILAVGQASATAQAASVARQQAVQQLPAAVAQPSQSQSQAQSTSTRRTLRTVTGQPVQPQVVTRTRSSQ